MHLHTHEHTLCIYTNVKLSRDLAEGQRGFLGSFQSKPISWFVAHTSFRCVTEDRTFRMTDLVPRVALTRGSLALQQSDCHW